jgi:hypothetical protein
MLKENRRISEENDPICRAQTQLIKNIGELNELNKRHGQPTIKISVKSMKASREDDVPQPIVEDIVSKQDHVRKTATFNSKSFGM